MRLSICVQTDEVPRAVPVALFTGTFAQRAEKARRFGADGLELMTVDPRSLEPRGLRATLAQHGLQAAAVGSGAVALITGCTLLHPDRDAAEKAKTLLAELIEFAAAIGAPLLTIGSFRGRVGPVGSSGRTKLADILGQGAEQAYRMGVRLAIEPVNRYELDFLNNAEEALAFVEEVNHPALGLLLDTFHMNIEERSWTEPFHRLMSAGRLWHIHIGDNNRLAPGQGLISFPAIVQTLAEVGYDAYLSAELLARPDGDTAASQTLAHMRPLLEK